MATVLFAWEMGGGLGHIMQMFPLAQGLVRRGHQVLVAFRNLASAASVFGAAGIQFLQAPFKFERRIFYPRMISFAHLLGNIGFGDDHELFALAAAWRNLFRLTRPDLIIFDHSPTALLAARGIPARRALIGTGFFSPPDVSPMPLISRRNDVPQEVLIRDEERILRRANWMLGHWKQPPLQRLAQLYAEVDENFLTTFPELDHYGLRDGVRYWGPVNASGGAPPCWPETGGDKRIYAYLKRFPALTSVLSALAECGHDVLVYPAGIDRATQQRFESRTLHFQTQRPDPDRAASECDLAVLNANHGTACGMLLAGKPMLLIPLYNEQRLLAEAIHGLGAAEMISFREKRDQQIQVALNRIALEGGHRTSAAAFARLHAAFDPAQQRSQILVRACELL